MHLPGPLRAAVGLAASAADEARHLPDRALELPMVVVGTALQLSLRAQQRYAMLAARGDEVLNGRTAGDDPPPWATFDDDPAPGDDAASGVAAGRLIDNIFGVDDPTAPASDEQPSNGRTSTSTVTPIANATGRTAAQRNAAKSVARKTPAKKAAAKSPAKKAAAKKTADGPDDSSGKNVSKPRHTAPSKFDDATDD